jgi:phage baseplate assembly protein W
VATPTPDPARDFLGVGWAYPARLDLAGHLARAAYEEDVCQAILIILGTNPGERVMRPTFGAGLHDFVFEPVSTTTLTLVRTRVFNALTDWEPRIEVERVRVSFDPASRARATLLIEINYRVRATNTEFNLVYPFYLEEGTPR